MTAPSHLSDESKREWRRFSRLFTITEATGRVILEYLEAGERMKAAQALVEKEGLTIRDRFQQSRAHPCVNIIRDAQSIRLRCLKELPLDGDKPTKPWSGGRKRRGAVESRQDMTARHREAVAALAKERPS